MYSMSSGDEKVEEDSEDGEEDNDDDDEEDEDGVLASGTLDDEVNATLHAIRNRDPRVYNIGTTFYSEIELNGTARNLDKLGKSPLYLSRYHRENILTGSGELANKLSQPTFTQQQDELKRTIVREIRDITNAPGYSHLENGVNSGVNDFLVRKNDVPSNKIQPQTSISALDVEVADKDPEAYLSKFMGAQAWLENPGTKTHLFQSDDDAEDQRAEEFEEAYNLRFENHEGANEKLVSHARDTVARYSVRKEPTKKRKRAREAEQSRKEVAKAERTQTKAKLRKLKIEDVEKKMRRFKDAAGLLGNNFESKDWMSLLADDWDSVKWEYEMSKIFDADYYAETHSQPSDDEIRLKKQAKKPKWSDDVEITDLIPNIENEVDVDGPPLRGLKHDSEQHTSTEGSKLHAMPNEEEKKETRKQRRKIEQLVEKKLEFDIALDKMEKKGGSRFKYRETSPVTFGLTSQDILLASDSQLNQYAGLKKLATFRDSGRKMRDQKHLGKKGRLRNWRKETFGNQEGPQTTLQDLIRAEEDRLGKGDLDNGREKDADGKRRRASQPRTIQG